MQISTHRMLMHFTLSVMILAAGLLGPAAFSVQAWQPPEPDTQPVQIGPLVFTVPADWLIWTYDEDKTERENEQDLIAIVRGINPALVTEATEIIETNIPGMIAAAFAPDSPGEALVYTTLMAFGYQASLGDLELTARATPEQVIAALGFEQAEQAATLTAGFALEKEDGEVVFTGGYALPDLDRIILMMGGADALGWQQYGTAIQDAIRSFALDDEQHPQTAITSTAPAATGDLRSNQIQPAQLLVLTPANPAYLYPYEFPTQGLMTGAVDLTQQPINPLLEKIEGTQLVPPVIGYVTAEPTFSFIGQPTQGGTVGVVFAADNYADTVLLVHCPNGEWHFADDVKRANADPAIAANLAEEGVYEVWIGTKLPNQMVSGTLYVLVQ